MRQKITPSQKALNLWAIILIVWSVYRIKFQLPEWFDEFIAKPLVFVLPVFLYIRKIEKQSFFEGIYLRIQYVIKDLQFVGLIAIVFLLSAILANFIKNQSFSLFPFRLLPLNLVLYGFIVAMATGFSEEVLSRGFVLKRLYKESNNIITSSFLASVLFLFLHIPILFTSVKISGNILLVFIATDLILSFTNSLIFLERKSLTLPIFIHALYNFSIILFI